MSNTLLYSMLIERKQQLERVLQKINTYDKDCHIPGRLRISKSNGNVQYYHVTNSQKPSGEYIRKKDICRAKDLAQKDYNESLLISIQAELKKINQLLTQYDLDSPEAVFSNMNSDRKTLIEPLLLSEQEDTDKWIKQSYETNPYKTEELVYETKRGELVRSKSEMLIADMYFEMQIPYRYECKIKLSNGYVKYPDFMFWDSKRQKVWYHEHFGMLDDVDYLATNLKKIEAYHREGIHIGKNLILTFETKQIPINIRNIQKMVADILA